MQPRTDVADSAALRSEAPRARSVEQLENCIRDLLGLLALPALWTGREPEGLLTLLCEALEAMLPIAACYARCDTFGADNRCEIMRVASVEIAPDNAEWETLRAACDATQSAENVTIASTPNGPLRLLRLDMDFHAGGGSLCVASADPEFPSDTQYAYLRAATSLAATGLQNAKLAREREEASRAKDEFLAMLGHELRNPLAPIVTALAIVKFRGKGQLDREHQIIERQVNHLTRLVDDLLDVARVTRGKIELRREAVEIADIIAKAVETANPMLEQHRHHLAIDVPSSGLRVHADVTRLAQVFANLLTNAAKYTPDGGSILVKAVGEGAWMRVSVRDNGVGIAPELLPRVFDAFRQGRVASDRSPGGLGLGLTLVKTLTSVHGGRVRVESEGPGMGSEFIVTLPRLVAEPHARRFASAPSRRRADRRERVLVVDDNHDAANLFKLLLEDGGHEVSVAYEPIEALALVQRVKPTVMLVDIGLPVMDGYELATRVREAATDSTPRLIALTGYGRDIDRSRTRDAGFEDHLVKPVAGIDLLAAVAGRPSAQSGVPRA